MIIDMLFNCESVPQFLNDGVCERLHGMKEDRAKGLIIQNHYLHSVPSGKSHYFRFGSAVVVFSIPANSNIGLFLAGKECCVWELSRLWAPDEHPLNLLSKAISKCLRLLCKLERPDFVVSYADPNVGHRGGIYRAASWILHGETEDTRSYKDENGNLFARRSFHSGSTHLTKKEINQMGYAQVEAKPKIRFVKQINEFLSLVGRVMT